MAGYAAELNNPINEAPELKPNLCAIVLHVDFGREAILLGADLEEDSTFGWSAVIADRWCSSQRNASIYKVAHHGSSTSECEGIWRELLIDNPDAFLTPFARSKLPRDSDKVRIRDKTSRAYITSRSSMKSTMDRRTLKQLNHVAKNVTLADVKFGAVRYRKKINNGGPWAVDLFGSAGRL